MSNKIADFMFSSTGVEKMGKYLDVASFRQKLIAGNISNVATPGYSSQDIDFQSEFKRAAGNGSGLVGFVTHHNHIPLGDHVAADPEIMEMRVSDGELNSVDPDKEVSNLAQNELLFTIGAKLLKRKFDGLRKAITNND